MENKRIKTSAELLADRSWTEFLKSLPIGAMKWRIENYRDFVSLRSVASMLAKDGGRGYSLKQDRNDNTIYEIIVTEKE